jgi:hypothetical protein
MQQQLDVHFLINSLNMFRASLCPSSGEQEEDCLKPHVVMPATQGEKRGLYCCSGFLES